jgi:hypothetical protein
MILSIEQCGGEVARVHKCRCRRGLSKGGTSGNYVQTLSYEWVWIQERHHNPSHSEHAIMQAIFKIRNTFDLAISATSILSIFLGLTFPATI